jgi:hypothetical protein
MMAGLKTRSSGGDKFERRERERENEREGEGEREFRRDCKIQI